MAFKNTVVTGSDYIAFRITFIELNGGVYRVLGNRLINDASQSVLKLNNEYLTAGLAFPGEHIDSNALKTVELYEHLSNNGIEFLYINAPHKIDDHDNQLPSGVSHYANSDADRFLEILEINGVPYVDLREDIHSSGINHYDMFFRTDHHWTPEAGLWAAGRVMNEYLPHYRNGNAGLADLYDISNYELTLYEDVFLGSHGRRTGSLYGGVDDFVLVTPRFETNFRFVDSLTNSGREGSFREVVIDDDRLVKVYYNRNRQYYGAYIGDSSRAWYIYNENGNGSSCLILCDSFGDVFSPFVALAFTETYDYDRRTYNTFDSLSEHIVNELQPDVVLILYYPNVINVPGNFNFG